MKLAPVVELEMLTSDVGDDIHVFLSSKCS